MRVYTVHVSADATPGDPAAFDKAILVRDGFTFFAFLFTALWFFAHRLWLAGLGVLVAVIAFGFLVSQLELTPMAGIAAHLIFSSLIGLEASSLRRWTYARRGIPVVDIVTGIDYEEAESKAAIRWLSRSQAGLSASQLAGEASAARIAASQAMPMQVAPMNVGVSTAGASSSASGRDSGVIGLFPERSR
jgi:hypothetical protein